MEFRIDFHIHSRHSSDGVMSIDKIFDRALKKGLNGVAIADHNRFDGSYEALAKERGDLMVIPAAEVSTDKGHMLCYFVSKGPADAGLKRENGIYLFDDVEAFVKDEGGLLFAAHPYRKGTMKAADVLGTLTGIEVFNGRNTSRRQTANEQALKLVTEKGLRFTAGSDAHLAAEIGKACRIFRFDAAPDKEDVKSALLKNHGAFFGSYSPLIFEGIGGIRHSLMKKDRKRFVKYAFKLAAGGILDSLSGIRTETKELSGGKIWEI